ncbi:ubinuclein-2b isoform 2-T2 [Aplochiton taeniatus]
MAEPRKVPFVTISSFNTSPTLEIKKRRREDDEAEISFRKDGGGGGSGATGSGVCSDVFGNVGNVKGGDGEAVETKPTVRLHLSLSEPSDRGSAEFNYSELVQPQVKPSPSVVPTGLAPALDPSDPFADDEKERREVEALAKKFENKYGTVPKKKKKDRVQDLIDIGYGYDDTDPFIDNSEPYDELVPASLTTKLGGFYINTGTLQFRAASDSEGEEGGNDGHHFKKSKEGEERVIKKRRKKQDGSTLEEKKPRKNKLVKQGVPCLTRPEKKKRKKLMKDSLNLANMLRRFTREKDEMRKKNVGAAPPRGPPNAKGPNANSALLNAHAKAGGNDFTVADLTSDPAVMSLLGSANNNDMLQDLMGDLDFGLLDSPHPSSPVHGENGSSLAHKPGGGRGAHGGMLPPPPLPNGLPAPLIKRIEDLRAASRQFDQEGRKKFFTLDMNNILLDIELQVQEQPPVARSSIYSHLEAFVPCNKEALLKRLKKLSLNIQDDRLRTPLLKLKLAVCSVMPEQIARYNMDCIAKVAKQQSEEGEKNGSEEEDEEKPGKRVMGPRKKFVWDDRLRVLLCNLVRVKLGCYELEGQNTVSPEDYLKAFMETEVKPLWPKGWMQARMLLKESTMAHGHLTGNTVKKATPKAKPREAGWVQRSGPLPGATPSPMAPAQVARRPPPSPSDPICLGSLDEELTAPSLDSISQALALLSNAAKGLITGDSPPSPGREVANNPGPLLPSPLLQQQQQQQQQQHKKTPVVLPGANSTHYASTSCPSPLSRPASVSSSPSMSSARSEGLGSMKAGAAMAQAQRLSMMSAQRPAGAAAAKASNPGSPSPPKPRPPPTASPLVPPGSKAGAATSASLLHKGGNNLKANSGGDPLASASPLSRAHTLPTASHLAPKLSLTPRLPQPSQTKSPPCPAPALSHSLPGAHVQSNFITPMQATLTKSSHSSTPPIIKLSHRSPNPSTPTSSASPHPRPQLATTFHQYPSKSPAGLRPFSGAQAGPAKPGSGQGSYTPPGGQKTPTQMSISSTNTSLTNTSPIISKHSGSGYSPAGALAYQGPRQRSAGGATQGAKPITSVSTPTGSSQLPQVSPAGAGLLCSSSLPLGFGMLGGLVPGSMPFQFPPLLNLPPLVGTAGSSTGAGGSAASTNAAFSTLTQNLYSSCPDVNQSQGGDAKRKTL